MAVGFMRGRNAKSRSLGAVDGRGANAIVGNRDQGVVTGFGQEWRRFDQCGLDPEERQARFAEYFDIFPWKQLPADGGVGLDLGCGSGRWAIDVARRVRLLHAVDASMDAVAVATRNLAGFENVKFAVVDVANLPFADHSFDFAYSLGVLHHVPDTESAIRGISSVLKKHGILLLYLYYNFDNRSPLYRLMWRLSDVARRFISRLPFGVKLHISQIIAALVYLPLARLSNFVYFKRNYMSSWPLYYYRDKSFYTMQTDALDRFGTRLERRFTREQIQTMLLKADFHDIRFSERPPFWCVCATRR